MALFRYRKAAMRSPQSLLTIFTSLLWVRCVLLFTALPCRVPSSWRCCWLWSCCCGCTGQTLSNQEVAPQQATALPFQWIESRASRTHFSRQTALGMTLKKSCRAIRNQAFFTRTDVAWCLFHLHPAKAVSLFPRAATHTALTCEGMTVSYQPSLKALLIKSFKWEVPHNFNFLINS